MQLEEFIEKELRRSDGNLNAKRLNFNWFKKNNFLDFYEEISERTKFLENDCKLVERLFCLNNNIKNSKLCECGIKLKFQFNGYLKFCSTKCMANNNHVKQKIKRTNLKKYGVENPFASKEIQEKIKLTNLKKYGVDNPQKNTNIKQKTKRTNLKKYGVENLFASKEIQEKIKLTNLKKYGFKYPNKSKEKRMALKEKKLKNGFNKLLKMKLFTPLFKIQDYNGIYETYKWSCQKCGEIFYNHVKDLKYLRCLTCNPFISGFSNKEKEVVNYVATLTDKFFENSKGIIKPYELDIYVKGKNFAIEFNGLYWHSSSNKATDSLFANMHINKTKLCSEIGIELFHIFENEWDNVSKRKLWKSIIKSKIIGLKELPDDQCIVKEIDSELSDNFLNNNHLHGSTESSVKLGLFLNKKLVSILTLIELTNNEWAVKRFTDRRFFKINGSLKKMIDYFKSNFSPNSIVAYSDIRFSNGKEFLNCGFNYIGNSKPKCNYFKPGENILKSTVDNYHNNYRRIWDCGVKIYKLTL